jgi:release factor glutamine methyltransferase
MIVEEVLMTTPGNAAPVIIDVGTGSGCLAVVLARELPRARVIATDVSRHALHVARRNAERHQVADRIRFVETSFLDGIDETADIIVSNPPYVPSVSQPGLTPEVRDYEPPVAVFAGEDGLDALRSVLAGAATRLAPGGILVMEFGCGQDSCVASLVDGVDGLDVLKIRHDLQDIPRTVICRKAHGAASEPV